MLYRLILMQLAGFQHYLLFHKPGSKAHPSGTNVSGGFPQRWPPGYSSYMASTGSISPQLEVQHQPKRRALRPFLVASNIGLACMISRAIVTSETPDPPTHSNSPNFQSGRRVASVSKTTLESHRYLRSYRTARLRPQLSSVLDILHQIELRAHKRVCSIVSGPLPRKIQIPLNIVVHMQMSVSYQCPNRKIRESVPTNSGITAGVPDTKTLL